MSIGGAGLDPTGRKAWVVKNAILLVTALFVSGDEGQARGRIDDGLAVAVGGLNSNVALFVSAKTYANLDSDLAALRMYDRSYKSTEAENGTKEITYVGSNGPIEVHVNNICKEGEAFAIPVQHIKRVGAKELSFQRPGKKDEFFQEIPNYAGYSLRAGAEFAILLERPAQAVKFINIVNS